jgi:hypothetical protein
MTVPAALRRPQRWRDSDRSNRNRASRGARSPGHWHPPPSRMGTPAPPRSAPRPAGSLGGWLPRGWRGSGRARQSVGRDGGGPPGVHRPARDARRKATCGAQCAAAPTMHCESGDERLARGALSREPLGGGGTGIAPLTVRLLTPP